MVDISILGFNNNCGYTIADTWKFLKVEVEGIDTDQT